MSAYAVVPAASVTDAYAGTDVPGEFRSLTDPLECEQVAVTQILMPPRSDFEQGTGHTHDAIEEVYILVRGTLTMRLGDDVVALSPGSVVRVAAETPRSHRNLGNETVELWAVSRRTTDDRGTKIDGFWVASPEARQHLEPGEGKL